MLSNAAMPGIVKIGMTRRNPEVRLKEINSATGVLPFALEAVVASRNAKWTEREVHSRLSGKRVSDNREFFRLSPKDARKVVFAVARDQRQRAYGKRYGGDKASLSTAIILAMSVLPLAWALDPQVAIVWIAACVATALLQRPRFLKEFLTMNVGWRVSVSMLIAGVGASMLLRPAWMQEALSLANAIARAV